MSEWHKREEIRWKTPDGQTFSSFEEAQAHYDAMLAATQKRHEEEALEKYRTVIRTAKLHEGLKQTLLQGGLVNDPD